MGKTHLPRSTNKERSPLAKQVRTQAARSRNGSTFLAQQGTYNFKDELHGKGAGGHFKGGAGAKGPEEKGKLGSVMEMESVDEFIVHAKMTGRDFEARRGRWDDPTDTTIVVGASGARLVSGGGDPSDFDSSAFRPYEWHALPMPERPPWRHDDSREELDARESEAFVEWRRRLALTEESVMAAQEAHEAAGGCGGGGAAAASTRITPFEKNLEVWRQLWRVVERSDVLVQVR